MTSARPTTSSPSSPKQDRSLQAKVTAHDHRDHLHHLAQTKYTIRSTDRFAPMRSAAKFVMYPSAANCGITPKDQRR